LGHVPEPDRAELWQRLTDQLDAYDGYQRKIRRQIDLVRLRPVGHAQRRRSPGHALTR